jgi:hypothetical protein
VDPAGNIQARLDRTRPPREVQHAGKPAIRLVVCDDQPFQPARHGNRVLAYIDVGDSRVQNLLNETLAYVATNCAVHDVRIHTDTLHELAPVLSRVNRNTMALSPPQVRSYRKQSVQMRKGVQKQNAYDTGYAVSI